MIYDYRSKSISIEIYSLSSHGGPYHAHAYINVGHFFVKRINIDLGVDSALLIGPLASTCNSSSLRLTVDKDLNFELLDKSFGFDEDADIIAKGRFDLEKSTYEIKESFAEYTNSGLSRVVHQCLEGCVEVLKMPGVMEYLNSNLCKKYRQDSSTITPLPIPVKVISISSIDVSIGSILHLAKEFDIVDTYGRISKYCREHPEVISVVKFHVIPESELRVFIPIRSEDELTRLKELIEEAKQIAMADRLTNAAKRLSQK